MLFIQGGHREADKIEGLKHARAAITGAGDDATALATAAMVMGHLGGEHRAAIDTIKSALAINPSSATVNYHACHIYYISGDFAAGRLHADRALRLSPRDPLAFQAYYAYGFTALHEGRRGEAAPWFAKAAQANGGAPHSYFAQAVALALDGCAGEGRTLLKQHVDGAPSAYCEMFSPRSQGSGAGSAPLAKVRRSGVWRSASFRTLSTSATPQK
jgi:tetratricopeptide (TPR) repeat protein